MPTKANIKNVAGVKAVIKDSGVLLESKLMTEAVSKQGSNKQHQTVTQLNHQSMAKDLKSNLLQLSALITRYLQKTKSPQNNFAKQLQESPSLETAKKTTVNTNAREENTIKLINMETNDDIETIGKQVKSSVAKIEVNQSRAIITHDNQIPTWSIEMPVKDKQNIDLLKFDIQADRDSKSENENEQLWTVNLKINFENKGSFSARLSIIEKEVSVTLWSENKTLNDLINNNLALLGKQMEKSGLSTGKIICLAGKPVEQEKQFHVNNLINITV